MGAQSNTTRPAFPLFVPDSGINTTGIDVRTYIAAHVLSGGACTAVAGVLERRYGLLSHDAGVLEDARRVALNRADAAVMLADALVAALAENGGTDADA
jgi:hypothetical protein